MEGTEKSIKQLVGDDVYWKDFGTLAFLSLLPSDFQEQLALPKLLHAKLKLPNVVSLRCSGGAWNVAVTVRNDKYYLSNNGWRQFVNDHKLKVNDLLTFVYDIDTHSFKVTMFDHSDACAKFPPQAQTIVDGISFPLQVSTCNCKPLSLIGHGTVDMVKFFFFRTVYAAYGVYMGPQVFRHLKQCRKIKAGNVLAQIGDILDTLISAPVEKFIRVVIIKGIGGSDYLTQLSDVAMMGLSGDVYDYGEDEDFQEVEELISFFGDKYLEKNSIITYHFPQKSLSELKSVEVVISADGMENKIEIENVNVVDKIQRWYLGGTAGKYMKGYVGISPEIITSLANTIISAELSK